MLHIKIRISHFVVTFSNDKYNYVIDKVINKLSTYKLVYDRFKKRNTMQLDKVFAAINDRRGEYRFNINILKDFMVMVGSLGITRDQIDITYDCDYKADPLGCSINDQLQPRDYQQEYIDVLLSDKHKKQLLVDLHTGGGKTFLATCAISKLNMRTIILVLPKYIDKWISDVRELTDVDDDQIYIVRGSDSLIQLMTEETIEYSFIIFSMRTMYNYIKDYENSISDDFMYPIEPNDLIDRLGVGIILNDETHQEFHTVFKTMLYMNPKRFIGLSATLDTYDKHLQRMYHTMFPKDARISGIVEYKPYVDTYSVRYTIENMKGIHYKRVQGYNHILYEQSIIRNSVLLKDYITMLDKYVQEGYISRRVDGDKCLIFVASIRLATVLANYFKEKYKDLNVMRYVEDDPYENVINGDLTITTPLSAGTALDIPGLVTVLQTVSIKSLQANLQTFGRLRNLKGKEMRFYYFYNGYIGNHKDMNRSRIELLKPRSKSWCMVVHEPSLRIK